MAGSTDGMVTLTGTEQDGEGDGAQAEELVITDNPEAGAFEASIGGKTVAGVVYSRSGDRVALLATSVFPEFRGQGIAAKIVTGVLDRLREEGATITVSCPFTATFVKAHPEYRDLLGPNPNG